MVRKLEHFVDKAIPPSLVAILAVLIAEIFFHHQVEPYHIFIEIIDYTVISIFAIDLYFKYQRLRQKNTFVKKYWIEIIAIFPFMLFFRTIERFIALELASRELKQAQMALHETVEVSKGAKAARTARFTRLLQPLLRTPRLLKAVPFYEKPH